VVQESLIFTIVLDLFLLQFVLGRGYFWSRMTSYTFNLFLPYPIKCRMSIYFKIFLCLKVTYFFK